MLALGIIIWPGGVLSLGVGWVVVIVLLAVLVGAVVIVGWRFVSLFALLFVAILVFV